MLVDRDGLWYRVLVAQYGEEGGFLREGGGGPLIGGGRWPECVMVVGLWARGGSKSVFQKRWVTGGIHFFRLIRGLGGVPLAVRFRRLYELCVNKLCSVGDMFASGWEEGEWEEELLGECRLLLSDVTLHVQTSDQWRLRLYTSGVYSVRSVYHMLTTDGSHIVDAVSDLI